MGLLWVCPCHCTAAPSRPREVLEHPYPTPPLTALLLLFMPRYQAARLGEKQEAPQGPWVRSGSPSPQEQSHRCQALLAVVRSKSWSIRFCSLLLMHRPRSHGESCGCPAMGSKLKKPRGCMVTAVSPALPACSRMRSHHHQRAAHGDCPRGAAVCSSAGSLLSSIAEDAP